MRELFSSILSVGLEKEHLWWKQKNKQQRRKNQTKKEVSCTWIDQLFMGAGKINHDWADSQRPTGLFAQLKMFYEQLKKARLISVTIRSISWYFWIDELPGTYYAGER